MAQAKRDDNQVTTLLAVSNSDGVTPVVLWANPTTHRLLVSATSGALDDLSDVVITSGAPGDILYHNGTNWVNLAAGTNGHFLKTQGAGANPAWAAATAGAAGADTQVQFNDGGVNLGGDAGLTYNKTTDALSVNGGIYPVTDDTGALGSATKQWADLFLASGGLIKFASTDVVLTHSAGILTVSTGDLRVTTAGTNAASAVTVGGTQTLTNKTLTSPTIGTSPTAAGATWTDLGTVTTADINGGTVDGAVIGGASAAAITGTTITANTGFLPDADGGAYLGQATQAFSGLFLDTLATINFDNGNAVITHSSGILTVSTGDLRVTTAGTDAASVVTVGGTQTLSAKTFVAPVLGAATATSINALTITSSTGTLTIAAGKTLTFSNTITFAGTDGTTMTFPSTSASIARTDAANTFTGASTASAWVLTAPTITTSIVPTSDDGAALGDATHNFSDLFLASGALIKFASTNVVITHTSGILTMGTGELRITTPGTDSTSVVTVGGTQTLTGKTLTSPTLTTPSAFTTGGNITLAENTSIALDPAGSADGKYSGITIAGTAGATLAFGDLIYLAVADSRWELTDADAAATAGTPLIGMCVLAAAADADPTVILLFGTIRADAKFPALTVGAPVYVGETAGAIQVGIPTGADNIIRVVGHALTADEIVFNPSQDHQVTVA